MKNRLFRFEILSLCLFDEDWYLGIGEIETNDFNGHLFYVQNWSNRFTIEVLYCKAFCQKFMDWVEKVRRSN